MTPSSRTAYHSIPFQVFGQISFYLSASSFNHTISSFFPLFSGIAPFHSALIQYYCIQWSMTNCFLFRLHNTFEFVFCCSLQFFKVKIKSLWMKLWFNFSWFLLQSIVIFVSLSLPGSHPGGSACYQLIFSLSVASALGIPAEPRVSVWAKRLIRF